MKSRLLVGRRHHLTLRRLYRALGMVFNFRFLSDPSPMRSWLPLFLPLLLLSLNVSGCANRLDPWGNDPYDDGEYGIR